MKEDALLRKASALLLRLVDLGSWVGVEDCQITRSLVRTLWPAEEGDPEEILGSGNPVTAWRGLAILRMAQAVAARSRYHHQTDALWLGFSLYQAPFWGRVRGPMMVDALQFNVAAFWLKSLLVRMGVSEEEAMRFATCLFMADAFLRWLAEVKAE